MPQDPTAPHRPRRGPRAARRGAAAPRRGLAASRMDASGSFGFRVWQGAISGDHRTHTHADLEWNYLLEGSARYFSAGRFHDLAPGRLTVFWGGIPHQLVDHARGTEMIWLTLPIAWAIEWDVGDGFITRMLAGEMIEEPSDAESEADAALLRRWIDDRQVNAAGRRKASLLEVQARLHRLSAAMSATCPRRGDEPFPGQGGQIERISAFVARHFREDIAVSAIAAAVGLHPNYAMNLFKRSCGMSLWEYVIRLRVSHAQRLLLSGQEKVAAIAMDSGFNSLSRFYEAFTRIVGRTPGAYRQSET